ncbi:polymer-forming cytoskeletal protein [Candidatus Uhrbacteria bacterium]|nr:polymer-forming cytoskeletal protein [Candidatus Uhrbacteria bacterium]
MGSQQETIIAQGVKVEGDFTSPGDVIIDGEVVGTVRAAGALRVGETAKIQANVTAAKAVIAGEVIGNMEIADRLEVTESSKITGDINTQILSVTPGASINGRVSMGRTGRGDE